MSAALRTSENPPKESTARERLTPEERATIREAYRRALELRRQLYELFAEHPQPAIDEINSLLQRFHGGLLGGISQSYIEENSRVPRPIYLLATPPAIRYHITMADRIIFAKAASSMEEIRSWIKFPDHHRPKIEGYQDLNNFHMYVEEDDHFLAEAMRETLGEVYKDFAQRYPHILQTIRHFQKDIQSDLDQLHETEDVKRAFRLIYDPETNAEGTRLRDQLYTTYMAEHPTSALTRCQNALNKAFNIFTNEYGIIHQKLLS